MWSCSRELASQWYFRPVWEDSCAPCTTAAVQHCYSQVKLFTCSPFQGVRQSLESFPQRPLHALPRTAGWRDAVSPSPPTIKISCFLEQAHCYQDSVDAPQNDRAPTLCRSQWKSREPVLKRRGFVFPSSHLRRVRQHVGLRTARHRTQTQHS
jgi:hypothetical protein